MSVTIENGKVTVTSTYGVTVNRGDYSSEKLSRGVSIEYDAVGESAVVLDASAAVAAALTNAVKIDVIEALGLEAKFDEKGNLLADLGAAPKAAPAPIASAQAPAAAPYSGGGGGGQQFAPPKVAKEVVDAQPTITGDLDGRGASTFRDLRGLKAAPGTQAGPGQYSPNAADFRDLADPKHQVWVRGKDGQILANVAAAVQAAGGTVE